MAVVIPDDIGIGGGSEPSISVNTGAAAASTSHTVTSNYYKIIYSNANTSKYASTYMDLTYSYSSGTYSIGPINIYFNSNMGTEYGNGFLAKITSCYIYNSGVSGWTSAPSGVSQVNSSKLLYINSETKMYTVGTTKGTLKPYGSGQTGNFVIKMVVELYKDGKISSSTLMATRTYTYTITFTARDAERLLSFNTNGGTEIAQRSKYYGYIESVSLWSSKKSSTTSSYNWTIKFYNGNSLYSTQSTVNGSITTTYTLKYWKNSVSGSTYGGTDGTNSTYKYENDSTNTATWNENSSSKGPLRLQSLPTNPVKRGYKFEGWYTSQEGGGDKVTTSYQFSSDTNVYAYFTPYLYKVKFDFNAGNDNVYELIDEAYIKANKIPDDSKLYGSTTVQLPITTYYRLGYTFVGWGYPNTSISTESVVSIQPAGAWMSDSVYNYLTPDPSTVQTQITLYGQWAYKNNTVNFKYFTSSDSSLTTKVETYNRSIDTYTYGAPVDGQWGGDYVFLGWVVLNQEQLAKWTQKKGVYNNELEIISDGIDPSAIVYPYVVKTAALKTLDEWGTEYTYYGIWTKTGKYIKVADQWRKVNTVFVKVDGRWRPVTNMYYKVNNTWQTELGIPE